MSCAIQRAAVAAVVALALAACGSDEGKARLKPVLNDEVRCLSCDADPKLEEQKQLEPKPRMIARPEELFFYPDGPDSAELEPKAITVLNATPRIAAILYAMVGEETDAEGGAAYFRLTPLESLIWLEPDAEATVWVTYLGSERQQSAVVVIYTSAPETPLLQVPLTGKFFFDG